MASFFPPAASLQEELPHLLVADPTLLDMLHAQPLAGIWMWDTEAPDREWLNPALCQWLNLDPAHIPPASPSPGSRQAVLGMLREQVARHPGSILELSVPLVTPQDTLQWVSMRTRGILSPEGRLIRILGAASVPLPATPQPVAAALSPLNDPLWGILDSEVIYVFVVDQAGYYRYLNPHYSQVWGQQPADLLGTPAMVHIVPQDWGLCMDTLRRCLADPGRPQQVVLGKQLPHGAAYSRWEFRLLMDQPSLEGNHILCIGYDVTDQIRQEQDHKLLLDTLTDGVLRVSLSGEILYASPSVAEPTGFGETGLVGQHMSVLIHPEDQPRALAILADTRSQDGDPISFVHRYRRQQNSWAWAEALCRRSPLAPEIVVVSRDISKNKVQADRLRQLALIAEHTTNLVLIADAQLRVSWVNEALMQICGLTPERVYGAYLPDVLLGHHLQTSGRAHLVHLMTQGSSFREEWQGQRPNGQPFWFEIEGLPVPDEQGQMQHFIAILNDISDRKAAEYALRREEEKYRTLVQSTQAVYFRLDVATQAFTFMDPKIEALLGYPVTAWRDQAFWESIIHPEDRLATRTACETATAARKDHVLEYRARHAEGHTIWIREVISVVSQAGKPVELIGFMLDNTPFEQVKARVEEQRHYLDAIYDHAAILFYVLEVEADGQFRYRFISPFLGKVTGLDTRRLIGLTLTECVPDFFPLELAAYFQERYRQAVAAGRSLSYEEEIPFGERQFWWLTSLTPVRNASGQVHQLIGISQEITAFKEAARERHFQANLLNAIGQAVIATDPAGKIIYWNQAATRLYGWEATEVMGQSILDITPPADDLPKAMAIMRTLAAGNVWSGDYMVHDRHNRVFPVFVTDTPIFNDEGELTAIIGVSSDISDRKAAEAALRESEARLRLLTDNMSEVFWLRSADHQQILYINPAYEHLWGQSPPTLYQDPEALLTVVHPEDRPRIQQAFAAYPQRLALDEECRILGSDEAIRWVWMRQFPFSDSSSGEVAGHTGMAVDISVRKQAEAIQRRAERMELEYKEMERFTYLASHDLKEPLRTITSFVSLLQRRHAAALSSEMQEYLSYIEEASLRMNDLIQGLLTYSRLGRNPKRTEVDCQCLVSEVVADLGQAIAEAQATIHIGSLPTLTGYAVELRQLFQNLIANAIKFRRPDVPPIVHIDAQAQDQGWYFSVRDNGIGIAATYFEKIFEIFQRLHQRHEYEGTGIGLAHCKKIVELHGGYIGLTSELEKGSTFFFFIPSTLPPRTISPAEIAPSAKSLRPART